MTGTPEYSPLVARHFAAPVNAGALEPGNCDEDGDVFTGIAGDRAHGAEVVFYARICANRVEQITFQAFGCPHTIAACSLATERLTGGPAVALGDLAPQDLADALQTPPGKLGRLLIVQDALHQCLSAWENRRLAER